METNESETRRSGMERASRGRNTSATDENILGFIILETKIARSRYFFFFFSSFFNCSTLLVNRDGTNLIGKSSGFTNSVFREQIRLDSWIDRNSKLLPFSLVKRERRQVFIRQGGGEENRRWRRESPPE